MSTERPLTPGEVALARGMFGDAVDYAPIRLKRRKWAFFQPRHTVMAPSGHLHFHPAGDLWRDDFAVASLADQGLFLHEMTHVWQHQRGLCLPLRRHPFCRYGYSFVPGRPLVRYGIEQQAEIVRHAFLLKSGATVAGAPELARYAGVLPFGPLAPT